MLLLSKPDIIKNSITNGVYQVGIEHYTIEYWNVKSQNGKGGIRTLGSVNYAGFQNRCIRPLCHLSLNLGISKLGRTGFEPVKASTNGFTIRPH